jgi:ABC-type transport system involved in multi-copper enzyme maturation permease subunit
MQLEAIILKDVLPYLKARRSFVRREIFAGVAAFMVVIGGAGAAYGTAKMQSDVGGTLFNTILWMILVAGTIQCTLLGATAISSERQRNTVDVWILAGMEHFGMVAAKVMSILTRTAATALAPMVPAAVALYLGGRTISDAAVGFLAVASILIFSTALSVSVSSLCKRNSDSIPAALAAMMAFAVAPGLLLNFWGSTKAWGHGFAGALVQYHPFTLLLGIGEERGADFAYTAFEGLLLSCLAALVLMILAGAHLRGGSSMTIGRLRPVMALDRLLERLLPGMYHAFKPAPGNPDDDPVLWRERVAFKRSGALFGAMTVTDKLVIAAAGLCWMLYPLGFNPGAAALGGASAVNRLFLSIVMSAFTAVAFLYAVTFIVRASQAFAREFETGQMDLLQLTRLSAKEIVDGKLRAYVRHYSPAAFVAAMWGAGLLFFASQGSDPFDIPVPGLGIPWVRAAGWVLTGFAAGGLALMVSLYCMVTTRAVFTALILYFGPALVLSGFTMGFGAGSGLTRFVVQTIFGGFILMRALYWARDHMGLRSRQECLLIAIVTSFGAAVSGPILGAFVIYVVTKALMEKNFEQFLLHGADRYRIILRRPALSYEYAGAYKFTHLGVPPAVERRLNLPQARNVIKEIDG